MHVVFGQIPDAFLRNTQQEDQKKKKSHALHLDKQGSYVMKDSNNKHDKVTLNTGNKHTGTAVTYRT